MNTELLFRCHCISDFASDAKKDLSKNYYKAVDELAELKGKTRKLTELQEKKLESLPAIIKDLKQYQDVPSFSLSAMKRMRRMIREHKYGIVDNLDNKYLSKGLMCEDDGISLLSRVEGKMYRKNTIREENEWLTGECDIKEVVKKQTIVTDIKMSWNSESYDNTLSLKKPYAWQVGVGYGWLFGSDINRVAHCLVNTPIELVKQEMYKFLYQHKPVGMPMSDFEFTPEATIIRTQFFRNHIVSDDGWIINFDGSTEYVKSGYWNHIVENELLDSKYKFIPIPEKQRVKIFQFKRDESKIDFMKARLITARGEINRLMDRDELEIYDLDVDECEA